MRIEQESDEGRKRENRYKADIEKNKDMEKKKSNERGKWDDYQNMEKQKQRRQSQLEQRKVDLTRSKDIERMPNFLEENLLNPSRRVRYMGNTNESVLQAFILQFLRVICDLNNDEKHEKKIGEGICTTKEEITKDASRKSTRLIDKLEQILLQGINKGDIPKQEKADGKQKNQTNPKYGLHIKGSHDHQIVELSGLRQNPTKGLQYRGRIISPVNILNPTRNPYSGLQLNSKLKIQSTHTLRSFVTFLRNFDEQTYEEIEKKLAQPENHFISKIFLHILSTVLEQHNELIHNLRVPSEGEKGLMNLSRFFGFTHITYNNYCSHFVEADLYLYQDYSGTYIIYVDEFQSLESSQGGEKNQFKSEEKIDARQEQFTAQREVLQCREQSKETNKEEREKDEKKRDQERRTAAAPARKGGVNGEQMKQRENHEEEKKEVGGKVGDDSLRPIGTSTSIGGMHGEQIEKSFFRKEPKFASVEVVLEAQDHKVAFQASKHQEMPSTKDEIFSNGFCKLGVHPNSNANFQHSTSSNHPKINHKYSNFGEIHLTQQTQISIYPQELPTRSKNYLPSLDITNQFTNSVLLRSLPDNHRFAISNMKTRARALRKALQNL